MSCRTSIPPSSGRRWSCTRRATCETFAELSDDEARRRRAGVAGAFPGCRQRGLPLRPRARQRGPRPRARACRIRTRSSSGCASRRPRWRASRLRAWTGSCWRRRWRSATRRSAAIVHPAGRAPYECLIAAREPDGFELDARTACVLRDVVRRLRALEGAAAVERVAARGPPRARPAADACFAGVELGAGIYVNTVAPEDAAARAGRCELVASNQLAALHEAGPRRSAARGSGGRPRSRRRGSGPCPSPA